MKIKQIRNATLKIEYAGKTFLIDPWLVGKGGFGSFSEVPGFPFKAPDAVKNQIPMPINDLPEPAEKILAGVDYYLVTHIHPDHIDCNMIEGTVGAPLDKDVTILVQDENDSAVMKKSGFKNVRLIEEIQIDGIKLTKTPTIHGKIKPMCDACGVVFQADGEKTLYLAGDTIWFEGVKETLKKFNPYAVILNTCAAELIGYGRLIMNDEDVDCVAQTVPDAKLILSHMDNVTHATITRQSMRALTAGRGIKNYFMPEDGEVLEF